ncbi:unnamed protein product [Paramecium primaurelia]|uniref:Uncharacterized protein n=1 Tax=Paramecium primaurelia TaxID=5886 RepID=A0A8S1NFS2_PARPR|nr:unnamed protein product [Paramecium primaurelia]
MDQEEYGEIENEDLNNDDFNYEEDLMGEDEQPQQPKNDKVKNPISNQRIHTPYPPEEEEEGEVYQYEDQSEQLGEDNDNQENVEQEVDEEVPEDDEQYNEEVNEEEQYDEEYDQNEYEENYDEFEQEEEDEIPKNNKQNKEVKDNKNTQSNQQPPLMEPPKKKKRPPLPIQPIKQKPTYQEKYAELMAHQDYSNWKPKQLHDENKLLRQKLKEISEEVSKLVEQNALRLPPQPQPQPQIKRQKTAQSQLSGVSVIDREIEINQKKLEQQEEEISKLSTRLQQIQKVDYIMKLDEEIKKFEDEMKRLEQRKKQEYLQQKQRGKDLDKYENQDGFDKLNKERNNLNQEIVNIRKKVKEQWEHFNKQKETIKNILEVELPKINQELQALEQVAEKYKIDISGEKPFSKQKEQYIMLLAQKDNLLKYNQIMEKKDKQLESIEKEIKELKKEKDRIDQQINANEMILIEQKKQKDELKNKVPTDVLKQIPATMTSENISDALQNEKKIQQESQRKLQSAKPPISKQQEYKELKIPVKQDDKQQQLTSKNEVEEEIVCEDENEQQKQPIKQEEKKQIPISNSTPLKQEIQVIQQQQQQQFQSPNQQNKLNSKPFSNLRKSIDQQPTVDLGLSNVSNQQSNTSDVQTEYTGPSRMMRMMRKPQQSQQEETTQFIIHSSKPVEQPRDHQKVIIEQNNKPIEQPIQIEQPKPVDDYQPTFPTRRITNRPRGLDYNSIDQQQQTQQQTQQPQQQQTQQTTQQPILINQKQEQTQQLEYPTRRRNRGSQEEQLEQNNNLQQSQQQSISSQQQSQQSYQPTEDTNKQRRIKIFTDEKQPEAPKTEEPAYEFQPRQEPTKLQGRRNRGNNKLNIWEDQPVQKENIEEIQEIKDVKQIPEVQHKEERELTLDEILGGPKQQDEYRPNQQKRKFEVPKDDHETYEPGFGGGGNRRGIGNQQKIDKQKELAQKAEKGDLLDDFDF